ncbi:MAG: hypothetical protein K0R31_121 [Clostridiales bacterium]|nr:hypothetical protein [Clostridiales bacterium]
MSELTINKQFMQKISGIGCIIGVILITAGSLLVPGTNDISNIEMMQQAFGENPIILQISAVFMVFGFWGLFIGVLGLKDSMNGIGAVWARIGFYFNLMGTTIWTIGMSLDISYPAAIINWLSAAETNKQAAYSVVSVLSPLGFGRGLFPIEVITIWLSYLFISLGIVKSNDKPHWLGYIGIVIGIAGIIMGICMVFTGREKLLSFYIAIMLLVLVWFLVIGFWSLLSKTKERKS